MPRSITLLLLVLAPSLALAQPADPPPADAPPPPPPTVAAPPQAPANAPAAPPALAPVAAAPACGPNQHLVEGACRDAPEHRGATFEASIGVAMLTAPGASSALVHGVGGLNLGVGGFVTHDVAFSIRASGVTGLERGFAYLGVIGPNIQGWFGDGWIGAGVGVGVLAGCGDTCGGTTTSGFNLRAGYAFAKTANVSLEMNSLAGLFSMGSIQTISFLIGYQSF